MPRRKSQCKDKGIRRRKGDKEPSPETSVEHHVDEDYPPTFIWCGKNDEVVPPENTYRMKKALEDAGVRHECLIFEDAPHGIGPGTKTEAEGWIDEAVEFISEG